MRRIFLSTAALFFTTPSLPQRVRTARRTKSPTEDPSVFDRATRSRQSSSSKRMLVRLVNICVYTYYYCCIANVNSSLSARRVVGRLIPQPTPPPLNCHRRPPRLPLWVNRGTGRKTVRFAAVFPSRAIRASGRRLSCHGRFCSSV